MSDNIKDVIAKNLLFYRNKTIKGFLNDALDAYKSKYRVYTIVDNYAIYFIPALLVLERK